MVMLIRLEAAAGARANVFSRAAELSSTVRPYCRLCKLPIVPLCAKDGCSLSLPPGCSLLLFFFLCIPLYSPKYTHTLSFVECGNKWYPSCVLLLLLLLLMAVIFFIILHSRLMLTFAESFSQTLAKYTTAFVLEVLLGMGQCCAR